jgi:8-oxo-dGTP diphosphatase
MKIEVVAKTIVVNADHQLLVLRRHDNDPHRAGQWDLPGGQANLGEAPLQAAIREANEEVGLCLSDLRPVHVTSKIHGDCQVIKTVFTTTTYTGKLTLSDEHSDAQWIDIDDFADLAISSDYKAAVSTIRLPRLNIAA